jgi:DNA-binding transcriptional MerR regulator
MTKMYYTITEVCQMLELKPHTIRYWETEFVSLKNKTKKGYSRRYTDKDLELLKLIKDLILNRRFTLEGARAEVKRLKKDVPEDIDDAYQIIETEHSHCSENAKQLREHLLELREILTKQSTEN